MITTKRGPSREALRAGKKRRGGKRAAPYHHGSLREAMLRAAETILERYWGINVARSCPRGGRVARRSKKSLRRRHGLAERSRRGWLRAVSGRDGGTYSQKRSGPCTVGSNRTRLCQLRADTSRSFSADVSQRASRFHPTGVAIGCRRRTRCARRHGESGSR